MKIVDYIQSIDTSAIMCHVKTWMLLAGFFVSHVLEVESALPVQNLRLTRFDHSQTPSFGISRLDVQWPEDSLVSCARKCIETYDNCKTFIFNSNTSLCTPGTWLNQSEPPPSKEEGDLYYMAFDCNATEGFTLRHYGNSTACVGIFNNPKLNYNDAKMACRRYGAYLASVKTLEKFQMLRPLAENLTSNVYVGCNDLDEEGKFIWEEDHTLLTQETIAAIFNNGEPNNLNGKEDCIFLYRPASYFLNDYPCSTISPYICELTIPE